ncbi:polyadenylate-binding protein-interacting protein 4-like isoform X2 [Curcuma longa]|uniref:polyadenylate-binding protein-interacting protein 4-like isoform X2 n=1 Tax=Curcuma longa TaxID=136217 RepID=UPI003D9EC5E2
MNSQQGRVSTNGYSRGRVDTVTGSRMENNMQSRKSASPNFGKITTPSRDRLIYVLSLLIGRHVEVHVKNGSIISGIFHATNADRDFEIVLKMAQVVKDGSVREQKSFRDSITSSRLMIVPARELVQLLAKDVSLDEFTSGHSNEKGKDLLIDSVISHSHPETERELTPWIPDEDDPECPELENIFDGTLDRNWDQFETNAALFGVKSTFNEELYTTKLERGPQMKELEKEASRIAREIEGQEAHDFHQAEERGFNFHDDLGLDEESRYSAVRRENNDTRFRETENTYKRRENNDTRFRETENTYNSEIFSGSAGGVTSRSSHEPSSTKVSNEVQAIQNETLASSKSSSLDEDKYLHADKDSGLYPISHDSHQASDCITQSSPPLDGESRFALNQLKDQSDKTENTVQESRASEGELEGLSTNGTLCSPSSSSQGDLITEPSDSQVLVDVSTSIKSISSRTRQGSSPNNVPADTSNRLSVSPRSCGSLSSEKSTLNPNAKEFKLNPNAKSFTPSTSERPHAEVSDGPFYYPNNVASFQHMHGLPVGMGAAPFGHHPVFYNPHAPPMQSSQAYIHPNGSMYGQQMIVGQPPQFYYVQGYPPEMPHKGRKY